LYEGWGLPVGESLAMGKLCVCSDRASIPEVAGTCGVYINIDDVDDSVRVIRELINDEPNRCMLESKIHRDYVPVTWRSVAERVVAACKSAASVEWQAPYPFIELPYSIEVCFGRLDSGGDAIGEALLSRIAGARTGRFNDQPLSERNFMLGEAVRYNGAWAEPEPWGTWACTGGAELVFELAGDASRLDVVLRLRVCGPLKDEPITLHANGELLWEGRVGPHPKDILLRVRRPAGMASRKRLSIVAGVTLTPELRNGIMEIDRRIPTIGFERLIVVPESDFAARLDLLGKLFMSR